MPDKFLYEELDSFSRFYGLSKDMPDYVEDNLNSKFELRPYQEEAFARFFYCFANDYPDKDWPLHFLFNMATGSGKTLIMAGLILYLYERGYRNFLFFVNATNIIEKTKDNFLNPQSSKYLFNESIHFGSKRIFITPVVNFEGTNENEINICFTTIQKLHADLTTEKENALTFEDFKEKQIVLLADEAHHINVNTRVGRELFESWENTVERIFKQNRENLLLEFTATLDYTHENIVNKYRNKVLYKYDLQQFRNDGYSKDVYIVQADFEEQDRIIQALILSQYKQEVAAKYRINLKPVLLFKAQRTIAQSKHNKASFHTLVENLTEEDILRIRDKSTLPLVKNAFTFFGNNGITTYQLAEKMRREFHENRCISVNEEKEKEKQQILLNTLEDKDNRIRAIFAVQKLNEGWDVLNLFDIVRCYTTRDARAGQPGNTTIAEAQLIGRGARYFPFVTEDNPDRYRRKFDKNLTSELRVLEELHYHSINDSRYISELRTALIEEGMVDEKEERKQLSLKASFRETDFYQHGLIYLNERVKNNNEQVQSFSGMGISLKNYRFSLATGKGTSDAILNENSNVNKITEPASKEIKVRDIPVHIIRNAITRNPFFTIRSLKRYFPHLRSIHQFIDMDEYLGGLAIIFKGDLHYPLPNKVQLDAMSGLLDRLESEISKNNTEYRGTETFQPRELDVIFSDKTLKLVKGTEKAEGDEQFVSDREWYVFNANYGTGEEKAFVRMLDSQMHKLRERYDGVYLIRNERHFKIYSFDEGQAFEPDFVLFLREKNGEVLTYQIFVEPKGKHIKEHDKWKENFLKQLTDKFESKTFKFDTRDKSYKYRLVGVPFYNNEDENRFKESLYQVVDA